MPDKKSISLLTLFIAIIMLGVFLAAFTDKVQAEEAWGSINYEAYQALVPTCLDRSSIPDDEYHWLHIPVDPGETGYIGVTFDSKGKVGKQKPMITVVTNARPRTYKLYLEGMVSTPNENDENN